MTGAEVTEVTGSGELRFPVPPRYGDASLSDVLPSVLTALGVPGVRDPLRFAPIHDGLRRAAVLLVDGLGYHQLAAAAEASPTIADMMSGRFGTVDRLTTGFPSTTPTSLVSLGTGASPGTHGVLGFTVRIPGADGRVLNHIQWTDDPAPREWQPVPTMFQLATVSGVNARVVSRPAYAGSGLTVAAYGGAEYLGGDGLEPLADVMIDALLDGDAPTLVYGYHPDLDHAGHQYGVGSPQWLDEVHRLERLLARLAARLPGDAALFVTADHGQLNVLEDGRFDVDLEPGLRDGIETLAGEPRVSYLYVRPGAREDVVAAWRATLGPAALVLTREEAVATGWYGPVTAAHAERLGDVVVICRGRHAVIASHAHPTWSSLVGIHGSLTAAEMEIPLLTLRW